MLRKILFLMVKTGSPSLLIGRTAIKNYTDDKSSRAVLRGLVDSTVSVVANRRIRHCPFVFDQASQQKKRKRKRGTKKESAASDEGERTILSGVDRT